MAVVVLLIVIWAAVLVPPAVRSQRARREAFEVSFGRSSLPAPDPTLAPLRRRSQAVQRRRRIGGGLLVVMVTTGVAGVFAMSRSLLVVHLFMVDSFLLYVATLAYQAEQRARSDQHAGASAEIVDLELQVPRDLELRPAVGTRRRAIPRSAA